MSDASIAYFTMEIALDEHIPTYSGGLGALAGDTIQSAADMNLPMVVVTLLHRKGYFYQRIDAEGNQREAPEAWNVEDYLQPLPPRVHVEIEKRRVEVRAWVYQVRGVEGHLIPVYLLDTDVEANAEDARALTDVLYGGDPAYRLRQEIVLGIGGVRMLRALGHSGISRFHMNEGHSSFLTFELLREATGSNGRIDPAPEDLAAVQKQCIFTTHTPVDAGHDRFSVSSVAQALGVTKESLCRGQDFCRNDELNMTYLGLNNSRYINGVAKRHGEVSRQMFEGYKVHAITNGVHAGRWVSAPFAALYDRYVPEWRADNYSLRSALGIPSDEIWDAHVDAKRALIEFVNDETNAGMDFDHLTLGFARRATPYKRADLLLADTERLCSISASSGPLQIIFSGKAHPQDKGGRELIQHIVSVQKALRDKIRIAYVSNYGLHLARLMTSGSDVWVNTPRPPLEASGTSGMKAALNGVPCLSTLDGWWVEGHIEGVTGWAIGDGTVSKKSSDSDAKDADSLYTKLERDILPLFYREREAWIDVMRHCISINGSFFNTQRMMQQYVSDAYFV